VEDVTIASFSRSGVQGICSESHNYCTELEDESCKKDSQTCSIYEATEDHAQTEGERWMSKFHKTFFKTLHKGLNKVGSSEFEIENNKKLSPTGLTRAELRNRGYEMIGSPVLESSSHINPWRFGVTSIGGNAIATDVLIKRDYRIPFEYKSSTSMWSRRSSDNLADVALEGEACCAPNKPRKDCALRGIPTCKNGLTCTEKKADITYRIDFYGRYEETLVDVGVYVALDVGARSARISHTHTLSLSLLSIITYTRRSNHTHFLDSLTRLTHTNILTTMRRYICTRNEGGEVAATPDMTAALNCDSNEALCDYSGEDDEKITKLTAIDVRMHRCQVCHDSCYAKQTETFASNLDVEFRNLECVDCFQEGTENKYCWNKQTFNMNNVIEGICIQKDSDCPDGHIEKSDAISCPIQPSDVKFKNICTNVYGMSSESTKENREKVCDDNNFKTNLKALSNSRIKQDTSCDNFCTHVVGKDGNDIDGTEGALGVCPKPTNDLDEEVVQGEELEEHQKKRNALKTRTQIHNKELDVRVNYADVYFRKSCMPQIPHLSNNNYVPRERWYDAVKAVYEDIPLKCHLRAYRYLKNQLQELTVHVVVEKGTFNEEIAEGEDGFSLVLAPRGTPKYRIVHTECRVVDGDDECKVEKDDTAV